jgi:NADH-quinone oxidoreductase subunit H
MVKAFVPRYRYDQLMRIGWKVFLPISLVMVIIVAFILQLTGWGWHGGPSAQPAVVSAIANHLAGVVS